MPLYNPAPMSKLATIILVSTGAVLGGCASNLADQSIDGETPLAAPVREASIVAPAEEVDVLRVEAQLVEELQVTGDERATDSAIVSMAERPKPAPEVAPNLPETPAVENTEDRSLAGNEPHSELDADIAAEEVVLPPLEDSKEESDVAAYLLDEAQSSLDKGNYEKARGQSERALLLEPSAARAYLILARTNLEEGRLTDAAEMARLGLASAPDSDSIFTQLNQILASVNERQDLLPAQPEAGTPLPDETTEESLEPL